MASNGFELWCKSLQNLEGKDRRDIYIYKRKKKKKRDMRKIVKEERRGKKRKIHECGRKDGEGRGRGRRGRRNDSVEKCHRAILIYNGREIGAANFVSETQKFSLVGIGTFIDVRGRFLERA